MDTKTKFSANGTYVLDAEDIEQLDELSLTSVLTEAVNSIPQAQPASPKPSDAAASAGGGDTTINEILRGAPPTSDRGPAAVPDSPELADSTGDLLAPELMFTDPKPPRR